MSVTTDRIVVTLTNGNKDEYALISHGWRIRNDQTDWLHIDRGEQLVASYPRDAVRSVRIVAAGRSDS